MADEIPLSEIADVLGGFAFKSEHFATVGFPIVKIANIEPPHVNLSDCDKIPTDKVRGLDRFALNDRDIVMAMTGATIGKVGRLRTAAPAYLNQRVAKITAKAGREFDDFVWAIVSQRGFDDEVLNNAGGSAQANVSTDGIGRIQIPSFAPAEQRAIGRVVGALDEKIELNRQMNRTLEELAAALFRSWFVDFDPVVAKAASRHLAHLRPELAALFPAHWQDSPLGPIPHGWRAGKVEELASLTRGGINPGAFPLEAFDHYSIPAFDDGRFPRQELGDTIKSNKFPVPPGCVMVSKLNPNTPRIWLPDVTGERRAVCSTEFLVSTPKPPATREFLFSLFSSEAFASSFATLVTGTSGSHQRVKPDNLLTTEIVIPDESLIAAFSKLAQPWLAQVTHNIRESRTLAAVRDTLLPKLLSGELRVRPKKNESVL